MQDPDPLDEAYEEYEATVESEINAAWELAESMIETEGEE